MQLFSNDNKITKHASEAEMQLEIDAWLRKQRFSQLDWKFGHWHRTYFSTLVVREFSVPEVGRRSDHVLLINNKKAVNLECKLTDTGTVLQQAIDHLRWCDYSIIIIPPDTGYVKNAFTRECMDRGIGLFYWFSNFGLLEFILPSFNRKKDSYLHDKIVKRILTTSTCLLDI